MLTIFHCVEEITRIKVMVGSKKHVLLSNHLHYRRGKQNWRLLKKFMQTSIANKKEYRSFNKEFGDLGWSIGKKFFRTDDYWTFQFQYSD
jgi:hypothetical protein